jgi:hypothetical protein
MGTRVAARWTRRCTRHHHIGYDARVNTTRHLGRDHRKSTTNRTPFFFDVSNVRSYKLSLVAVPLIDEKTKTDQDETDGVAVSTNNVASKKTEIGNAERTAKMLKDEIRSLDGEQRAAIMLEANLKHGEAERILELADTTHRQLEATIADSHAQLRRITGLTALD